MTSIDFSPLFRNSVGYDRVAHILTNALGADQAGQGFPPYNIEVTEENTYAITLALAGFVEQDLDIQTECGVLSIRGRRPQGEQEGERRYLHRGIANRSFERKFNLAEHVEVRGAELVNGILTIQLVKEVPETMKPQRVAINGAVASPLERASTV